VFVVHPELVDAEVVELGDPGRDRELAGVLFAAYVTSGGAERKRVTGWVAARDTPPSLPEIGPSERLRGRPGKVAKLLACTDDALNWVTLDERTDIRRGLNAKAPTDQMLKGFVWWWFMATDDAARVPAEHVSVLREALVSVLPVLEDHPYAAVVANLVDACTEAEGAGVGLCLESVGVDATAPPERRKQKSQVASPPARSATDSTEQISDADEPVAIAV
ncbi:MAG: hypothetical protein ACR2OH_08395, partial [Microthrixaceae bacterium]